MYLHLLAATSSSRSDDVTLFVCLFVCNLIFSCDKQLKKWRCHFVCLLVCGLIFKLRRLCHFKTLQCCNVATLQLYNFATLQHCKFTTLQPCNLATLQLCSFATEDPQNYRIKILLEYMFMNCLKTCSF